VYIYSAFISCSSERITTSILLNTSNSPHPNLTDPGNYNDLLITKNLSLFPGSPAGSSLAAVDHLFRICIARKIVNVVNPTITPTAIHQVGGV